VLERLPGGGRVVPSPVRLPGLCASLACDPLGSNPYGVQMFAMRPDGSGLRQLTAARGLVGEADGTVSVE
jgi:hypothetical protein